MRDDAPADIEFMIVTCPACSTKYALPDNSVSGEGRTVRCARCGHQWYLDAANIAAPPAAPEEDAGEEAVVSAEQPEVEEAAAEPAAEATEEAVEDSAADDAAEDEAPAADGEEEEDPWERRSRRAVEGELPPTINRAPTMPDAATTGSGRGRAAAVWLVFAALVGGTIAGAHYGKDDILDSLPQAQPYYEMLGYSFSGPLDGLDLPEVKSTRELQNGSSVLIVEGKVSNTSAENKRVPELQAELLDASGVTISTWKFTTDVSVVAANGEIPFQETVVDPDPRAENVAVSFVGAEESSQ
ncbi:MAG: zinc-ribbon domain-containing protein [Alphaproteobacteria bacterium]|nr:zinc-ribbon domain-containing protein [Alphaproteobacteria bacterium SS10]